jgi:hypothetical protein
MSVPSIQAVAPTGSTAQTPQLVTTTAYPGTGGAPAPESPLKVRVGGVWVPLPGPA